jgi:hypothetical protein
MKNIIAAKKTKVPQQTDKNEVTLQVAKEEPAILATHTHRDNAPILQVLIESQINTLHKKMRAIHDG